MIKAATPQTAIMLLVTGKGPIWKKVVAAGGTGGAPAAAAKGKNANIVALQ
ncbi:MAG: hypothetical protein ACKODZ_07015 [Verrucomicrobiota bacterium]